MTMQHEFFAAVTPASLTLDTQWTQTYRCALARAVAPA